MLLEISQALETFLENAVPVTGGDWVEVGTLHSDADKKPSKDTLILFLYAVGPNGHMRNLPPVRVNGGYRRPPLVVQLRYLVTHFSDDAAESQMRLSRVLEAFHGHPRLGPAELGPLADRVDHLSVRLRDPGPEELNQLWTALGRGLRLALFYDVEAALIEPMDAPVVGRVTSREFGEGTGT